MSYDNILAKSPSIIFRPGATSAGLAVETWAQVKDFVTLREGNVIVFVDDSLAAAHVPATSGVTDFQGRGEIRPYQADFAFPTLTIDDGATLRGIARISGTTFIKCDTRGAVPGLDWDYSTNPAFYVSDNASIGMAATATQPGIVIPSSGILIAIFANQGGVATTNTLIHFADASGLFILNAFAAQIRNASDTAPVPPAWVTGAGTFELQYDSNTIYYSLILPQTNASTTFYYQTDGTARSLTFLASATNVLGSLQSQAFLRQIGTLNIKIEGYGGSGGGGGGQGGTVGLDPGVGGGGAGGCQYQSGSFNFDLTHQLSVTVGAGGAAGAAGAGTGGAGGDGGDGQPSFVTDTTSGVILASLIGSNRGGGGGNGLTSAHGGSTYAGSFYPQSSDPGAPSGQGFVSSGGFGGDAGADGTPGQNNFLSLNPPGGGIDNWSGGAAGSGAAGGGGGGGGGAGTFADGALGGDGGAGVGSAGGSPTANTGAGAAGGGGGGSDGSAGGAGGAGASGRVTLSFLAP